MKKVHFNTVAVFIIVFLLFRAATLSGQTYNKQNTYLDALELKDVKATDPDTYKSILSKYGNDTTLTKNPFLKDELTPIYVDKENKSIDDILGMFGGSKSDSKNYNAASLISPNWQASTINGMANFMAGRFRQEVLQMSLNQIFKQIKKDDNNIVKYIFPQTYDYVRNLYGNGTSSYYTADLLLLRQTAQIDLDQVGVNIARNPDYIFPRLKDKPEVKDMLTMSDRIVEYSQQGKSLDKLISSLADDNTFSTNSKIRNILNITDIISQALLNKNDSTNAWVNPTSSLAVSTKSLENPEIKYFYGLLYQQLVQIPEFKDYLTSSTAPVDVANKIQNLTLFVNKLNSTYDYLKSKEYNLQSTEEVITYIDNIDRSITSFAKTVENIPQINKYYNFNDSTISVSSKYISLVNATLRKDYQKVIPLLIVNLGNYLASENKSLRILSFISELATIESAEDMESLLNAYALPIGSSSIKRHASFDLSLNGYVGITGGFETAYGSQMNQTRGNIGLSAPIGISTTFIDGHITAFLSFIDLGSIVNQRLNNDVTSYSNLKFQQFFAPGLGIFYNFPKLPVTAGANFNFIPNLRTIKYESGNATITESNTNVTRFNLSLLIDIPIYTFYHIERKESMKK